MRIVRFREGDAERWGSVLDGDVSPHPDAAGPTDVVSGNARAPGSRPLAEVALLAPVVPPRNVFCVGWNYVDHFAEGLGKRGPGSAATELPDRPTFFTKATGTVIGPFDPIESHGAITDTLDWEVELAVVIGRGGRDIQEADALEHVLGVAVANDVSARNVQRGHGGQWFRGKSLDATCPIGPWLVTLDEFGPIADQPITCRVNGETVQSATLADMHFNVPRIIAELSAGLTLVNGDIILTGTPSGVGFAREPARYLSAGDVVESEIGGIGTIRNEVRA